MWMHVHDDVIMMRMRLGGGRPSSLLSSRPQGTHNTHALTPTPTHTHTHTPCLLFRVWVSESRKGAVILWGRALPFALILVSHTEHRLPRPPRKNKKCCGPFYFTTHTDTPSAPTQDTAPREKRNRPPWDDRPELALPPPLPPPWCHPPTPPIHTPPDRPPPKKQMTTAGGIDDALKRFKALEVETQELMAKRYGG